MIPITSAVSDGFAEVPGEGIFAGGGVGDGSRDFEDSARPFAAFRYSGSAIPVPPLPFRDFDHRAPRGGAVHARNVD